MYNVFTLRKPIHKLRIYANSRKSQTMSREHCGRFYFLKNGETRMVRRTYFRKIPTSVPISSSSALSSLACFIPCYSSSYLPSILSFTLSFLYNNINFYAMANYLSSDYRLHVTCLWIITYIFIFTLVLIEFLYSFK